MTEITARLSTALADRYKIERRLGEGGMATVYLAEDLKHKRKVALKVLKPELAAVLGAERFVQEITTTASLQHPNILPLFDSGEADGFLYYVMPFVEGETLRDKLNRETQLGIDEAVKIATEVADALDYAHRQNVIHRDIKPENILLHDGRPMVADFGIALAVSAAAGGRMTETGLSLGTPHYMSPEQATAEKDLTNRSDIYSLGAVLYEMLTGDPPHTGSTAQQIIMKIVTDEAQLVTKVRKSVPPNVAAAVAKALEKLPADRFGTAADLADALTGRVPVALSSVSVTGRPGREVGSMIPWIVSVIAVIVAAIGWFRADAGDSVRVVRSSLGPMNLHHMGHSIAVAPDGEHVIFTKRVEGVTRLYLRRLDDLAPTPIPGTEGGHTPVFSPDGAWLAFKSERGLKKTRLAGGTVQQLVEAGRVAPNGGATWGSDDHIYFPYMPGIFRSDTIAGTSIGLARVPSSGGEPEILTVPRAAEEHAEIQILPGAQRAIFTVSSGTAQLGVLDLETLKWDVVSQEDFNIPRFVAPDLLLFATDGGSIMAATFDPRRASLTSAPAQLVASVEDPSSISQQFAVSLGGVLAYVPDSGRTLAIVDRDGAERLLTEDRRNYWSPRFSPGGNSIAVSVREPSGFDIWVYNVARGTARQLTRGERARSPVWSPDGSEIAYAVPGRGVMIRSSDGVGNPRLLVPSDGWVEIQDWSPDGQLIAYREWSERLNHHVVGVDGDPNPRRPFEAATNYRSEWRFAPSGSLIAYTTLEFGNVRHVVLRDLSDPHWQLQVTAQGGGTPVWKPDGAGIYYLSGDYFERETQIMEVAISDGARPTVASDPVSRVSGVPDALFDIHPDGREFVIVRDVDAHDLILVQNWPRLIEGGDRRQE